MENLGILHRQKFQADKISGGEMQRVAIARALICNPPLVLADEPTAHLDKSLSIQLMKTIETLKQGGKTILITSHDPLVVNHQVVDTLYAIHDGRLSNDKVL